MVAPISSVNSGQSFAISYSLFNKVKQTKQDTLTTFDKTPRQRHDSWHNVKTAARVCNKHVCITRYYCGEYNDQQVFRRYYLAKIQGELRERDIRQAWDDLHYGTGETLNEASPKARAEAE